jgi:hypothetical protein
VPLKIPEDFKVEQAKLPVDPDHPNHHCYQCKRRLPQDFPLQYWQELDLPKGPFFHTEQCRHTTLNRHRASNGDYIETYRSLLKEYSVFVRDYERKKAAKEAELAEKQRQVEEKERVKREEQLRKENEPSNQSSRPPASRERGSLLRKAREKRSSSPTCFSMTCRRTPLLLPWTAKETSSLH